MSKNVNYGEAKDNYRSKQRIKSIAVVVVLVILTFICLLPIYAMLVNSSRAHGDILRGISFIPGTKFVENFKHLSEAGYAMWKPLVGFRNSLIIAIGGCILSVFFSTMTAYGLTVYDFKARDGVFTFIMAVMMVPTQVTAVGFVQFMSKLGLTDSYVPLLVPAIAAPAVVFYMKQYMQSSFPLDIVEASRIDGCGEFRTFLQIGIPMCKPAVAVQCIFAFIANWNNYYTPSMILISRKINQLTMPMMITSISSDDKTNNYGDIYMALSISILPVVVVYLVLSRFIIEGVALGGVKE